MDRSFQFAFSSPGILRKRHITSPFALLNLSKSCPPFSSPCSKMARTRASTSIEDPRSRSKRHRLERGEQSREETSDRKGKRREEEGGEGDEGIYVVDSDNDIRSGADDVILLEELHKLERGEQFIEETSDRKGKRREEKGVGGGDEGIFVIDSDNDVRSGTDDVLLSEQLQKLERGGKFREETNDRKGKRKEGGGDEGIFVIDSDDDVFLSSEELQIQEILFMTMQSEKERENLPLVTEEDPGSYPQFKRVV